MGIPRPEGIDVILLALFLAAAMVLARGVVFFPLLYFTGLDRRSSVVASTKLSQISEFCLVIAYLGMGFGHLDSRTASAVIFAFVLTALATPFLFRSGDRLHDRIAGILTRLGFKAPASEKPEEGAETYDIILLGFHRAASSLFFEIERAQPELIKRILVVDFNVGLHEGIQRAGAKVVYGDISDLEALVHLGVDRGRVVCCTVPDDVMKGITNVRLTAFLRHINPRAMIIVNAVDLPSARKMYEAGADFVFLPRIDAARNLLCAVFAGLRGDLKSYRAEQEACHGRLEERREILP
jgi:voltage-gated potassium channel Kch